MQKSRTLKAGLMIAMMSARDAMDSTYDYEFKGADLFLSKSRPKRKFIKKIWYTVDSPEVKAMSNQG